MGSQQQTAAARLRQPQFGLRTLLVWVTAMSAVCWLLASLSAAWALGVTLTGLIVFAHVVGNSLGHRLRARAPVRNSLAAAECPAAAAEQRLHHARPSQLRQHHPLHGLMFVLAGLGAVVGGAVGGAGLHALYPDQFTVWRLAVAALASGAIGALVGFACGTFVLVTLRAWRDATR